MEPIPEMKALYFLALLTHRSFLAWMTYLHRQDGVLARMVGEYWRDSITAGTGRYFNCNAVKDKYKYLGIGMISFNQLDRVSALKNRVASYLTKVDYWVRLSADSGRSFFRGNMPKLKTMKRGRPRRFCRLVYHNQRD